MSLHGPIFAHLKANAGVAALVTARIYRDRAKEIDPLPYITYFMLTGGDGSPHATGRSGLVRDVYQINAWALTRNVAVALAKAIYDALPQSGVLGAGADVKTIQSLERVDGSTRDADIPPTVGGTQGSDVGVKGVQRDYEIWYIE